MPAQLQLLIIGISVALAVAVGALVFIKLCTRVVPAGMGLVVRKMSQGESVTFSNAIVLPWVHHATLIDITVKTLRVERTGKRPLVTKEGALLHALATFSVRISKHEDGVLHAAQTLGARVSDEATLRELFGPKFEEALETVAAEMTADDLLGKRQIYKDQVLKVIGCDLNGFVLDDMAIHELVRAE